MISQRVGASRSTAPKLAEDLTDVCTEPLYRRSAPQETPGVETSTRVRARAPKPGRGERALCAARRGGRTSPDRALCAHGSARERPCFGVDRPGLRGARDRDHRARRRGYTLIDDASCERPYDNDIRSDVCFERRGPRELHLERPRAGARCIRLAARTNHQEWLVHLAVRPVDISRCSTVHIADVERLLVSRRRPHVLTVGRQRADEEGDYQRRDLRAGADGRERLHRPVFHAPGLDPVLTAPELPISRTLAGSRRDQNARPYRAVRQGRRRRARYVRPGLKRTTGRTRPYRAICTRGRPADARSDMTLTLRVFRARCSYCATAKTG